MSDQATRHGERHPHAVETGRQGHESHGHHRGPSARAVAEDERGETLTIAIIADDRHAGDAALRGAVKALERDGCTVQLVVPDPAALFDMPSEAPLWDAVVSRGRSPAVLTLLAAAASLGVLAINTPRAIDLVRNKVAMQSLLARHGMPVPMAWYAADPAAFRRVPAEHFPLVVKPFDGDGSAGLSLMVNPEDRHLEGAAGQPALFIAQEYLEAGGDDLKLYVIGSDVWAVRKPSPVRFDGSGPASARSAGGAERVEVDATLRDIALTCGRACGLELWGVDVAVTANGPVVIEVNDFPTYSAVPEAGALMARHILALTRIDALRRQSGQERMRSLVWSAPS